MTTSKRGHAINGDLFTISHGNDAGPGEDLDLDAPFTTFIDVSFRGLTHQAFAAADRSAFSYANASGEFTVGDFSGYIVESLDHVETQVSHRYQALVDTPHGVLSSHSYDSVPGLLALIGALRPQATRLGVTLDPDDEVEYSTAPRVAMQLEIGVVELTPLTAEVIDELPTWQGTAVAGGELYAGRFTDTASYLTLVTPTCRVLAMPGPDVNEDVVVGVLANLNATWQA